jgi:hypothetical protein
MRNDPIFSSLSGLALQTRDGNHLIVSNEVCRYQGSCLTQKQEDERLGLAASLLLDEFSKPDIGTTVATLTTHKKMLHAKLFGSCKNGLTSSSNSRRNFSSSSS